ncbi:MAG: GlsB/YeaQ/YmgE family stress response membrane protein [Pseudorhodoplanes sp.]|nr:GlsB/YeaQ/YmgE family stress response membrane protein [Pseudorhodoplanes sp.]
MGDMQGILGNPGVGLISMLIIGAIAGWIAEKITESDHGIFTNILVGIAGAFVGGKLADVLQIAVFGFFRTLIAATIGAIIILFLWRRFRQS